MKPCNLGAQVRIGVALMLMYSLVQAKHVCQEITCRQVGTARWTALACRVHMVMSRSIYQSTACMLSPLASSLEKKNLHQLYRNEGASKPQKAHSQIHLHDSLDSAWMIHILAWNCTELYYSSCDFSSSPDELDMLHHNLIICKSIIIATILFGHKCAVHTNVFPHKPCSCANAVMGNHVKVTQ